MRILASEDGPYLTRPDEDGYVEAVGERMALLGREQLECWMWPLKLFEEFELRLSRGGEPLELGPRTVHVVPEGLGLEWPDAGVLLEAFACRDSRGLVLLVSVEREDSVEVELRFRPAFRPMWPAGLGGQVTGRDDATGAFLLTEELGRFAALIGAPEAEVIEAPEDRGVRELVSIRLPISPARGAKGPVPVVIAGAQVQARPLTEEERRGGNQSATGTARSAQVTDDARELYRALTVGWPDELERQRKHWSSYLERTAHLEVDADPELERAFLWSKIAIERCWVNVDGVGRTLVAGLGPSFGGERPGFAWFFNGDALVATRALAGLGDYQGCRDVFRFAASTQREDGKIAHEISLSAGLCDWYEDYPYAYYKGQITPGFVSCLARYVGISGDLDLARELWPNVVRAIEWCKTTLDDQGRMQVPLAGIAAVEAGPLAGRIQTESYLQGIWMTAILSAAQLAKELDDQVHEAWSGLAKTAIEGLRTFWREDLGRMGFAHLDDGSRCDDLSAYVALPLSRGGALGRESVLSQNRPEVMSDWGARMFATNSALYDPEHYNTGSVFPYLTNFSVLALSRMHPDAAWQVLRSQVELDGFGGLGYLPEFLAGDRARLLPRSVPHQVFSQTTVLQGVLSGLLSVGGMGPIYAGLMKGKMVLGCCPYMPPGLDRIALRGVPVGESRADLVWNRSRGPDGTTLRIRASLVSGSAFHLAASFLLPPLTRTEADCGETSSEQTYRSYKVGLLPEVTGSHEAEICARPGPELALPFDVRPGEPSCHPRLVGRQVDADAVHLTIAGPAGTTWQDLTFPPGEGFTETTITLRADEH